MKTFATSLLAEVFMLMLLLTLQFPARHTEVLEEWIDRLDAALPPLTNFIIPVSIALTLLPT